MNHWLNKIREREKERRKYLGFNDIGLMLVGIPLVSFIITILFFIKPGDSWIVFWKMLGGSLIFSAMYWLSIRYIICHLRKRYSHIDHTKKRLTYAIIGILLLAPLAGHLLNALLDVLSDLINYERLPKDPEQRKILPAYIASFFMLSVYEAKYFYFQLKKSIIEKEQAKQAQIRSELQGLRNQVNPHFLFNSMNTLMNIVVEDQQLAVNFLRKLSKVYRYVLENRTEETLPLVKELDFIKSYIFLQKERFKGNLEVIINIPERDLDKHIIPLSLQMLFENAIKHNIISKKKPLLIEVFVKNGKLFVQNNLQRKVQIMDSTKVGLENIKTRYQFFTGETVEVMETKDAFTVAIPLLIASP
jgi:sensor histidine kinase YesM